MIGHKLSGFCYIFLLLCISPSNQQSTCEEDFNTFHNNMLLGKDAQLWAIKSKIYWHLNNCLCFSLILFLVSDSYGSFPRESYLEGNHFSLGSYHSCLEVESGYDFEGQYCHVHGIPSSSRNSQINNQLKPLLPPSVPLLENNVYEVNMTRHSLYKKWMCT